MQNATKDLYSPSNKCKRASSSCRSTKGKVKRIKDLIHINADIVIEETTHRDKSEETDRCCIQATPSPTVDDVKPQNNLQRVGLLREKLFRLGPSSNQNTLIVHEDAQAVSQPSIPTLNVEPATESESDSEDERGRDKIQIHSKGDNKPTSELEADADSHRDVEEEVLPDNTGRSCTPVKNSQNSKYDVHCLTVCKSGSLTKFSLQMYIFIYFRILYSALKFYILTCQYFFNLFLAAITYLHTLKIQRNPLKNHIFNNINI